jgi:hypothetical protein
MRSLLWVAAAIGVMIAIVVAIGWLLPVAHVATVSARMPAPPPDVYSVVSDLPSYPAWWSDDPRIKSEIVSGSPPVRLVTRIADPDQPFGGTWTFVIAPQDSGSLVTITEHGEVYNPLYRFMSRYVFGHTQTMTSFLRALETHLAK